MNEQIQQSRRAREQQMKLLLGIGATMGGTALVAQQPASAQTAADSIEDITTTVTSLGTLLGGALIVALGVFGTMHAFKVVRGMLRGGGA